MFETVNDATKVSVLAQLPASARLTDALSGETFQLADIQAVALAWQQQLSQLNAQKIVLLSPGTVEWALLDLACSDADVVLVPLPTFISPAQLAHVLSQVQPDLIISSRPFTADFLGGECIEVAQFRQFWLYQPLQSAAAVALPAGCQKITFTSGSTGTPKGVCLSAAAQWQVAQSLVRRIGLDNPKHLAILPLSTLLENIAGIYAPLLAGGEVLLTDEANRGFAGSRLEAPAQLLQLISRCQPDSLILVPELLQLLVVASQRGWQVPASLKFIAVGGAKVAPALLQQAAAVGLPVYQGYGLSECCSVVALSSHSARDVSDASILSAVGQPLAHVQVKIVAGELWVQTPFLGYLGESAVDGSVEAGWVATGDLAELDPQGNLHILGRKKNLLISSLGRNIHPEWVESELLKNGLLQQVVVFGDAKPYCVALLYCQDAAVTTAQLQAWLSQVNRSLPDYAQVQQFYRLSQPLSEASGTLTANQRPKRAEIARLFAAQLAAMYPIDVELAVTNFSKAAVQNGVQCSGV